MRRIGIDRTVSCLLMLLALLALTPDLGRAQADGDPLILGTYRMVPSRILGAERRIVVCVPEGYAKTDRTYPVFYKLHGSSIDFLGQIAGRLSLLAESGRIPEAILIGVEQHGHGEMLPRGSRGPEVEIRAEEFMRFLREELVPFVDREYRTQRPRILLGTYDCGLFAIHTLAAAPGTFDAYLASSPDFQRGGEIVLERARGLFADHPTRPAMLHVTHRENAEGLPEPATAEFLALLEQKAPESLRWSADLLPLEDHDRWAPYVSHARGLLAYFDGFACPAEIRAQGLAATRAYYQEYSRTLGFEVGIPERTLHELGAELYEQRRWSEAIETLEQLKREHPGSLNAGYMLGRTYRAVGDFDRAIENYRAILQDDRCPPFFRGELEAIERSAAFAIERAMDESGLAAGMEVHRAVAAGERPDLILAEGELNEVGYRLFGEGRLTEAIAVFELGVTRYPESANAYDSLGEACLAAGDTTRAVQNYRRSLALNPHNENAARVLEQIAPRCR